MDSKPGIKTSEFWLTLAAQVVPLLVIFGVISQAEAHTLAEAVGQLIVAVAATGAAAAPVWKYIDSRTKVKTGGVVIEGKLEEIELAPLAPAPYPAGYKDPRVGAKTIDLSRRE